jgi:ElaB/YqjD/DUF883 family membrane-anchored ribosome-binding protein
MSNPPVPPKAKRDEWSQAGEKAADTASCAGEMATHAAGAVGDMAKQAACDVGQTADDLTAKAGSNIERMGQMLSDNTPKDGMLGSASQAVAQSVQRGGRYLEEAKLSGAADSLTELIRQHPVAAIVSGIAVGYLLGRALRS